VALVICGLFICDFAYMRSRNDLFSGTYPLSISHPWSFYMRNHYMRVYFWSSYLSHITRSNCIGKKAVRQKCWWNWLKDRIGLNVNRQSRQLFQGKLTFPESILLICCINSHDVNNMFLFSGKMMMMLIFYDTGGNHANLYNTNYYH